MRRSSESTSRLGFDAANETPFADYSFRLAVYSFKFAVVSFFDSKLYFEHDAWDLSDPVTRQRARTLADQVIEVTGGNEVGHGIIEYGVGKGYAAYESVQAHPPI